MPKSINLGNGTTLIGLDAFGQVKDLYFHYPGLENHVGEYLVHKIGIYVDGTFSWLDDGDWVVLVKSQKDSMASAITAVNEKIGVKLYFTDVLYNEKNIFVREITIENLFDRKRDLKIFFNAQFNISETYTGDTAYFDPRDKVVIHYKGRRVFLVNAQSEKGALDEYAVGLLGIEGQVGTYKDAEDGKLSKNAVEHGMVDSVVSLSTAINASEKVQVYYFLCIGKSIDQVKRLNTEVLLRHPKNIIESTIDYWKAWVDIRGFNFYDLGDAEIELFNKSLLYIRAHVAKNGAIIASGDSEMLQFGRDYYRYVWHRDASVAANALSLSGDLNSSKRFFKFCKDTITKEGFFMHKYRPDKSVGSSWHPWVVEDKKQYPIQEDETASVIIALYKYFELSKDIEFIEYLYNSLIKPAADFMSKFRDTKTGLPNASYDIWEQYYGISTYTSSCVYAALKYSGEFAKILGKETDFEKYSNASNDIKKSILKYLFNKSTGNFYKMIRTDMTQVVKDEALDMSSIYGVFKYGILEAEKSQLKKAIAQYRDKLELKNEVAGICRYEGDSYHHKGGNYPGNPWVITTMWLAQYYIETAKSEKDLDEAKKLIGWAVKHANPAGILPEQLDPYDGSHLSASPLVESHGEYVITILCYLEKLEMLGIINSRFSKKN